MFSPDQLSRLQANETRTCLCVDQDGVGVEIEMNESRLRMQKSERFGKLQDALLNLSDDRIEDKLEVMV